MAPDREPKLSAEFYSGFSQFSHNGSLDAQKLLGNGLICVLLASCSCSRTALATSRSGSGCFLGVIVMIIVAILVVSVVLVMAMITIKAAVARDGISISAYHWHVTSKCRW